MASEDNMKLYRGNEVDVPAGVRTLPLMDWGETNLEAGTSGMGVEAKKKDEEAGEREAGGDEDEEAREDGIEIAFEGKNIVKRNVGHGRRDDVDASKYVVKLQARDGQEWKGERPDNSIGKLELPSKGGYPREAMVVSTKEVVFVTADGTVYKRECGHCVLAVPEGSDNFFFYKVTDLRSRY